MNEIEYVIPDKKYIVKYVSVSNQFITGNDYRMVRSILEIHTDKERQANYLGKEHQKYEVPLKDETEFETHITRPPLNVDSTEYINTVNFLVFNTITEAQIRLCKTGKCEESITRETRECSSDKQIIRKTSKAFSKVIKKGRRNYKK